MQTVSKKKLSVIYIYEYKNKSFLPTFIDDQILKTDLLKTESYFLSLAQQALKQNIKIDFVKEIENVTLLGYVQPLFSQTLLLTYEIDTYKELDLLRSITLDCITINHHNFTQAIKDINKIAVEKLGVMRSSLWVYYSSRQDLECIDLYEKTLTQSYQPGDSIKYLENDSYFELLKKQRYFYFNYHDSLDTISSDNLKSYIKQYNITYKYDIAIFYKERLVAILCFESIKDEEFLSAFFLQYGKLLANNIELIFAIKFKDENEEKLQAIVNNEHTGIIIYRDHVLYANQAITNINGYTFEEMRQLKTWELFAPESQSYFEDLINRRMKGEHFPKVYNDAKVITKSGEFKNVRISAETIMYEGRYAGISTITDITDLINTKEKLHILAQAVEQSDELIRIIDRKGYIIYANAAVTRLTGYLQYELFGAKASILKSGKHSASFYKRLWEKVLNKEIFRDILINKKKNQELYYEDITISPILDEKGDIKYFVSTGKDVTEQIELQNRLKMLATTDTLTQIHNRFKMNEIIDFEIKKSKRFKRSFVLMMFDIDYFKQINDTYGHDIGDEVLKTLAQIVQQNIREVDSFGRWGGEEFMILLRDITITNAKNVAHKILSKIRDAYFVEDIKVTISLGLTAYNPHMNKMDLLKNVDIALYEAKTNGRDRIVIYND